MKVRIEIDIALDRFGGLETMKLDDTPALKPAESVMIFGAGGGIGHLAVQLAKRMGARMFAVASGSDGVALVKRLGADAVLDGQKDDILLGVNFFPFLQAQGDRHRLA